MVALCRWALVCALVSSRPADSEVCSGDRVPCFALAGGKSMPQVAMGTWSGSYKDCGKSDFKCIKQHARFAIENWLHIGGTHVDGANDYRTQTDIASALQASGMQRDSVFLTTKCPGAIGYEAIIQCADDNLQMLGQFGTNGVAYIDLLLVHFPFKMKPMCRFHRDAPECKSSSVVDVDKAALQDTWRGMEELKRIGVVKSIGVSDYNVTQLQQTLDIAKEPIEVNQIEWNPKNHPEDMYAFCSAHNILVQAWSPLGGASGSALSEPAIKSIAAAHNVTTAQVALRWSLQRKVAVVVGTANADHQLSDIDVFGFSLSSTEMEAISALQSGPQPQTVVV